jgi:hypothetical protein
VGQLRARERSSKPGLLPHPACYATASLAAFTGRALMIFRAGLALKVVASLVRIDALARLRGGLLDDGEFGKPWHDECAGLLFLWRRPMWSGFLFFSSAIHSLNCTAIRFRSSQAGS